MKRKYPSIYTQTCLEIHKYVRFIEYCVPKLASGTRRSSRRDRTFIHFLAWLYPSSNLLITEFLNIDRDVKHYPRPFACLLFRETGYQLTWHYQPRDSNIVDSEEASRVSYLLQAPTRLYKTGGEAPEKMRMRLTERTCSRSLHLNRPRDLLEIPLAIKVCEC